MINNNIKLDSIESHFSDFNPQNISFFSYISEHYLKLAKQLDLLPFLSSFFENFARAKELFLQGDSKVHLRFISALENIQFTPPPKISPTKNSIAMLKKFAHLKLSEIYEISKIIRYFEYLKNLQFSDDKNIVKEWLENIKIPESLSKISNIFELNSSNEIQIKNGIYPQLDSIKIALKAAQSEVSREFSRILSSNKIAPYLVDSSAHLINGEECLLLKPGFNHILAGSILDRSSGGFFYVLPRSVGLLRQKVEDLENSQASEVFKIEQELCVILGKNIPFLNFIDKEFDRFDSYAARLAFARSKNYEFLSPKHIESKKENKALKIVDFKHPALKNPVPISIDFSAQILMITGVNAGGKTMLLKSILSVVFLAKALLPMPINAAQSSLCEISNLHLILEDPQNSKNDISTFGGRMLGFSRILREKGALIGVDEIELGTDSDEAASLFLVLLNELKEHNKIIITTHHKRLAALMAGDSSVQLLAALFDLKRSMPTFGFLSGTIGKSYAFETAERYGIPRTLVQKAREAFGEDKEKLNDLIENSSRLEMRLRGEIAGYESKKEELDSQILELKSLKERIKSENAELKENLEREYNAAISAAKAALKGGAPQEIHKMLNSANKILNAAKAAKSELNENFSAEDFVVGMRVKFRQERGIIISLNAKSAMVLCDSGIRAKIDKAELKALNPQTDAALKAAQNNSANAFKNAAQSAINAIASTQNNKINVRIENPKNASVSLDLHGLRAEEAIEKLDEFISNCLIAGFDEVLVYHGIGTGRLSAVVRDFLKEHPKVVSFEDAPSNAGGFGAKIVRL